MKQLALLLLIPVAALAEPPPQMEVRIVRIQETEQRLLCYRISDVGPDGRWLSSCAPLSEFRRCVESESTISCPQPGVPPARPLAPSPKKSEIGA